MLVVDIWREQPGKYFCISTKTRGGVWHDEFFHELDEVADYVREHRDRNVYFCPHGFRLRCRKKRYAVMPCLLWSDMDDVRYRDLRPTIAIESSPGRRVGLWETDRPVTEQLNERLALYLGDKQGGWDVTQVLRVPRTTNYKYASRPLVRVLWDDGPTYSVLQLDCMLPRLKRKAVTGRGDIDFDAVRELNGAKLSLKYKVPISAPARDGDRSATWMWQAGLARENGASDEEIGAILLRCRRTFLSRFPDGLDDYAALEEIERLCSKLEK
jgi:hypothetical protein